MALLVFSGAVATVACNSGSEPDPNVPQLLSPGDNAVLDNGCVPNSDSLVWDFDWSDVAGATAYELYVRNADAAFAFIDDSTLTESSYHLSQPSTYQTTTTGWAWWVRAKVDGAFHDWAGPLDFSVEALNTDCP